MVSSVLRLEASNLIGVFAHNNEITNVLGCGTCQIASSDNAVRLRMHEGGAEGQHPTILEMSNLSRLPPNWERSEISGAVTLGRSTRRESGGGHGRMGCDLPGSRTDYAVTRRDVANESGGAPFRIPIIHSGAQRGHFCVFSFVIVCVATANPINREQMARKRFSHLAGLGKAGDRLR